MKVWDLPTRLYHWLQVILVVALMYTGTTEQGPHTKLGLALLTLLIWRIIWGFIGSQSSQFLYFIKSPFTVIRYLKGNDENTVGHNPAGGYMVVILVLTLFIQALTGLALAGYLDPLPGSETWLNDDIFDLAVVIHENGITFLYALIGLHLSAILIYKLKSKPLVLAMFTGIQKGQTQKIQLASNLRAIVSFAFALAVTFVLYFLSLE